MTPRSLPMIAAALHGATWAIRPETLEEFRALVRRDVTGESRAPELNEPAETTERVTVRDGVATVAIGGPLFRYANLMTAYCGASSYADVQHALMTAAATPGLKAIVLAIDSPGGECRGMLDTAAMIYGMRGTVPIVAHVDGMACSAALLLAAACDRIIADPAATIGCAGAVIGFDRVGEADEDARTVTFTAARSPRKNASVLSKDGASQMQQLINVTGDAYFAALATYRGVDAATVHEVFGLGAVFGASDAIARGMIDAVMVAEALSTQLVSSVDLPPMQGTSIARPSAALLSPSSPTGTAMADQPPVDTTTPEPTSAFAVGAAVRSAVSRDVTVAENDEGTVVEVLEAQTLYAVEFAGGTYSYLTEADLAPVEGAAPDAPAQAKVRAAIAAARVKSGESRIAGLVALTGKVSPELLTAAMADPTQTAASVALAHLTAAKASPLAALQADAQGTPSTPDGADSNTPSPRAAAAARAARINKRFAQPEQRTTSRSGR
jgi:capsid assembly protease